jgi:hypothetical protein
MSSGRYQSQLFNFLNRQTQKVADKTSLVLRHLKVTAIWGTQIVLYPVYALFQTTRLVGRQLGQSVQRSLIRLQLRQSRSNDSIGQDGSIVLSSDLPLQNVLTSVKRALLSGGDLPDSNPRNALVWIGRVFLVFKPRACDLAPSNPYNIQGIASLIDTRGLVLILEGNVIFDTLTDDQQRQIQQRILFELARYWRWRRKLYLKPGRLSLPDDRETVIPPVRVFRQLMAWIQASPVAIATNLFQESAIVPQASAELEWFSPNVPLSAWNPANAVPKTLPSQHDVSKWVDQLPKWNDFESLIWAAIHYFFGDSRKLAAEHGELAFSSDPNPWLNVSDVFGGSKHRLVVSKFNVAGAGTISLTPASASESLALPERSTFKLGQSVRNFIQSYLKKFSTSIVHQSNHLEEQTIVDLSDVQDSQIVVTVGSIPATVEPNTSTIEDVYRVPDDWIETEATHVEYVRSPWETFLNWLDSGMHWLEQHIVLFWRWLTHSKH